MMSTSLAYTVSMPKPQNNKRVSVDRTANVQNAFYEKLARTKTLIVIINQRGRSMAGHIQSVSNEGVLFLSAEGFGELKFEKQDICLIRELDEAEFSKRRRGKLKQKRPAVSKKKSVEF